MDPNALVLISISSLLVHSAEKGLFLLRVCKMHCWIFLRAVNVLHKAGHTCLSLVGEFFLVEPCLPKLACHGPLNETRMKAESNKWAAAVSTSAFHGCRHVTLVVSQIRTRSLLSAPARWKWIKAWTSGRELVWRA